MLILGSRNNDVLSNGISDDFVYGFDGNDRLGDDGSPVPSNDMYYGGAGNDVLTSYNGFDGLYGGAGRDTIQVFDGGGNVTARGGKGFDTLVLNRDDLMFAGDEQFLVDNITASFAFQLKSDSIVDVSGFEAVVFI